MPPLNTTPAHPRQHVYLAGPLGAETLTERQEHYRRIVALARFAVSRGFTPVVPHLTIGVPLGWPEVGESPEVRAVGLQRSLTLLRTVSEDYGALWVLLRDDGSPSAGVRAEMEWWRESAGISPAAGTWAEWCVVGVS